MYIQTKYDNILLKQLVLLRQKEITINKQIDKLNFKVYKMYLSADKKQYFKNLLYIKNKRLDNILQQVEDLQSTLNMENKDIISIKNYGYTVEFIEATRGNNKKYYGTYLDDLKQAFLLSCY